MENGQTPNSPTIPDIPLFNTKPTVSHSKNQKTAADLYVKVIVVVRICYAARR